MNRLMEDLSERYSDRIVIFDSPPILATSEACILSHQVGQVVLVVESEKTRGVEIEEAIERLETPDDIAIGLILNKNRRNSSDSYYSYNYNYG